MVVQKRSIGYCDSKEVPVTAPNGNWFWKFQSLDAAAKFEMRWLLKILLHTDHVATLPYEIIDTFFDRRCPVACFLHHHLDCSLALIPSLFNECWILLYHKLTLHDMTCLVDHAHIVASQLTVQWPKPSDVQSILSQLSRLQSSHTGPEFYLLVKFVMHYL